MRNNSTFILQTSDAVTLNFVVVAGDRRSQTRNALPYQEFTLPSYTMQCTKVCNNSIEYSGMVLSVGKRSDNRDNDYTITICHNNVTLSAVTKSIFSWTLRYATRTNTDNNRKNCKNNGGAARGNDASTGGRR